MIEKKKHIRIPRTTLEEIVEQEVKYCPIHSRQPLGYKDYCEQCYAFGD